MIWIFSISIKPELLAFQYPPVWIFKPTLSHYAGLIGSEYLSSLKNSAIVSVGTVIFSLLIAVPAAYGLARGSFRMNRQLFTWTFLIRMAPGMIFIMPFFAVYLRLHLIDTYIGLILLYMIFNLALVVGSMMPFFAALPIELEEAAMVEGATIHQSFMRIALPLSAPGLATTAILGFLASWNEFFWALILTRVHAKTAAVAIMNFMKYEGTDWGQLSAGSIILIVPVVLFSFLVRKHLVRGLTSGALKG